MKKIAFLFSGQGAQYTGMGKSLTEVSKAAAGVFEKADAQRPGTSEQCFTGSKDVLNQTLNTQPCVYAVDLAAARALQENGFEPACVAGFSLGEIAALTFAGVFDEATGFDFVCHRAQYMSDATALTGGSMAAILKLSNEKVNELAEKYDKVFPVNYNCPGQVSCAGDKEQLDAFCKDCKEAGARAVPLAVSGAFHSPFMDTAAEKLKKHLEETPVKAAATPIYANKTAALYPDDEAGIRQNIADQVNHPVRWQETLETMWNDGVTVFVECGPGKTLAGLVKKTLPEAVVCRVEDADTLNETLTTLRAL